MLPILHMPTILYAHYHSLLPIRILAIYRVQTYTLQGNPLLFPCRYSL